MATIDDLNILIDLIRNETAEEGNTKERVADTLECIRDLNIWEKNTKEINLTHGQTWSCPAGKKGDKIFLRIRDENGDEYPNGTVWFGGYNGVALSHNSLVIFLYDSDGGNFATVGYRYGLISNRRDTSILFFPTRGDFPDEPDALPNIIYVAEDTLITYVFKVDIADYVIAGEVLEGVYVNETTFNDIYGNPYIPTDGKIYLDVSANKTYHWNGLKYVLLASSTTEAVLYTPQNLNLNQRTQALLNLGFIQIEGNLFGFRKKNPFSLSGQPTIEPGDYALNGFADDDYYLALEYVGGNPKLFASWQVVNLCCRDLSTKHYGVISDPNETMPEGEFRTGDYYIQTDNGGPDGVVQNIWLFTDIQSGDKFINPYGSKGDPGATPEIGNNGNWWINGVDTGVNAKANKRKTVYDSEISGLRNGTNAEFTVVDTYIAGTLKVYLNGLLLTKGNNSDYVENSTLKGALMNRIVTNRDSLIFEYEM